MFKTFEKLVPGEQFYIASGDKTSYTFLGSEQSGGRGEDTRLTVWARPSWVEYGKVALNVPAELPVLLVRRNAYRKSA